MLRTLRARGIRTVDVEPHSLVLPPGRVAFLGRYHRENDEVEHLTQRLEVAVLAAGSRCLVIDGSLNGRQSSCHPASRATRLQNTR